LSSVYNQFGSYDEGVRLIRQALASTIQLRDVQIEAQVRERLGSLLREQGNWTEALAEFEQAGKLFATDIRACYPKLNGADLQWRMGRRGEAVRVFAEVDRILNAQPNQGLRSYLNLRRAQMAYADGDLGRAREWVDQSEETETPLLTALLAIRGRARDAGERIAVEIAKLERAKLAGSAAGARLLAAEALLVSGNRDPVPQLSLSALGFFEPRRIWESIFRAQAILAQASAPGAEAADHAAKARAALDALRNSWPADLVGDYLKRADIRTISKGLQL
jgi:hypothetical protein